jgi:hypothetical protein
MAGMVCTLEDRPTPPPSRVRKLPLEPQVRSRPYAIMSASEAILCRAAPFRANGDALARRVMLELPPPGDHER